MFGSLVKPDIKSEDHKDILILYLINSDTELIQIKKTGMKRKK